MIAAALVLFVACGTPARPQTAQPNATLDQLLAPIALYPDQLLAQMLMSATDPAKVTELDTWLKANQKLKGTQLQDAAVKAGFEPSFVALALFPQVVAKMADQIAWTTLLGQSFTSDRNAVFDSIQRLRQQARNVGTLKSSPQQEVETKTTSAGQEVIVIEPTNPQIVYVPQYNTRGRVYAGAHHHGDCAGETTMPTWRSRPVSSDLPPASPLVRRWTTTTTTVRTDGMAAPTCTTTPGTTTTTTAKTPAKTGWITARISSRSAAIARRTDRNSGPIVSSRRRSSGPIGSRTDRKTGRSRRRRGLSEHAGAERTTQRSRDAERASERTAQGATTPSTTAQAQRSSRTGSTEARGYGGEPKSGGQSTEQRRFGRVLGILERGIATFLQRSRAAKPQQLARRRRWRRRASSMTGASERRS